MLGHPARGKRGVCPGAGGEVRSPSRIIGQQREPGVVCKAIRSQTQPAL